MSVRILEGDVRARLAEVADASVHCVVTSPPYWGLRDYGVAGQIGLEPTLGEHIETLVGVFREVRRVLRPDGTLWLNYGDCYASTPNGRSAAATKAAGNDDRTFRDKPFSTVGPIYDPDGGAKGGGERGLNKGNFGGEAGGRVVAGGVLKPKDLCMVANRLAIALQEDGWWVRSEIVWHKPNPMPESIADRPTTSHEKVWLLSKSARYFFDADAVREDGKEWSGRAGTFARDGSVKDHILPGQSAAEHRQNRSDRVPAGRNIRNVWTIPTAPCPDAHFATFPPALVEPCINAGTSERGVCPECGAPWRRLTSTTYENPGNRATNGPRSVENRDITAGFKQRLEAHTTTIGWHPTCGCDFAEPIPATLLDPFAGAGTVGLVAARLRRDAVLIELSPEYAAMARQRIEDDAPLFAEVAE